MNIPFQPSLLTYPRYLSALLVVLLSGGAWYWGDHITGNNGWLMWIAPIPVLLFSFQSNPKQAFAAAFMAYLVGRLGFLGYLTKVIPLPIAILVTILQPLIIAGIVLGTRKVVLAKESYLTVFAFPVLWTAYEFLISQVSADGTAASSAYSQMNYVGLIQVAALTGIGGITFLITLVPSAIAVGWHYRQNKSLVRRVLGLSAMICLLSAGYGQLRLSRADAPEQWKVGVAVLSENQHHFQDSLLSEAEQKLEKKTADEYVRQIHRLAQGGAQWVVLPERAVNINAVTQDSIISFFQRAAQLDRIGIVIGLTLLKKEHLENVSLVIAPNGKVLSHYQKVYLVRGLEDGFRPGNQASLFTDDGVRLGTAICKDLDFPGWMRNYRPAAILLVPAWDFVVDGWLHSRMAFLRCVENGYGMVRAARQGRLSIVDYRGRVLAEASCENGQEAYLIGKIPVQNMQTFYSQFGNWFGWLITVAAVAFLVLWKGSIATRGNNSTSWW